MGNPWFTRLLLLCLEYVLRGDAEMLISCPLRVLGKPPDGVLTPVRAAEFCEFWVRTPWVPGQMTVVEAGQMFVVETGCISLKPDRPAPLSSGVIGSDGALIDIQSKHHPLLCPGYGLWSQIGFSQ